MKLLRHALAASALALLAQAASAAPMVKEYMTISWNSGTGVQNTVAAVGGLAYGGQASDVASLAGTDIVVAGQWNAAFSGWVAAGGVYVWHDWNNVANQLPGLAGAQYASMDYADINVIDSGSAIVNGPFGVLTNALLDGGSASAHGAWRAASLVSTDPLAGAVHAVLSSTDPTAVVMFEMRYGQGHILYANMPLEAYTDSNPLVTASQPAGLRVYANNELAYAKALVAGDTAGNQVPEPGALALSGLALAAAALARRRVRR